MALTADSHVYLAWNAEAKDATVGTGDPSLSLGDDDVAIWGNTLANINLRQQHVGDFRKLHRWIQSENLKETALDQWASMPTGGGDGDIAAAAPGAGEVGLYVGAGITTGNRSHRLDETFKQLINVWLESSKDN